MRPERHSSVVGHSKDSGCGGVGDWAIVQCYYWLKGVFSVPGCDEGEGGLGGGDLESICVEPLFKYMNVFLEVCGRGVGFRVLCVYGDVFGV